MSYLETPHLPRGRVVSAALGVRYAEALRGPLAALGVAVLPLPENPAVDARLASHADLELLHLGGPRFAAAAGLDMPRELPVFNTVPVDICDSALNCCAVGRFWFCCLRTAALIPADYEPVCVRQRYTRCSTCVVDERSLITADRGIAAAAARHGLDALLISPGHIRLDGYDTGFIGGASFKLAPDRLAFTGSLETHPDGAAIRRFLSARDVEPVFLTAGELWDIGSAIPLQEEISA